MNTGLEQVVANLERLAARMTAACQTDRPAPLYVQTARVGDVETIVVSCEPLLGLAEELQA